MRSSRSATRILTNSPNSPDMRLEFAPYVLRFKRPSGTSRGILTEKLTYLLRITDQSDPERVGIGEAALFRGLSAEDNDRYVYKLIELLANIALGRPTDLSRHPSIQFGLEQAILDFSNGGKGILFPSPFTRGEYEIDINGLVWMGPKEDMLEQVERKIADGYKCIKLKIGAIDWASELEIIRGIRERFSPEELTIRVDANGAFTMDNVFPRLRQLDDLGVHSIEQPIRAGNWEQMHTVCKMSPVPVALDEELIGVFDTRDRELLLDVIRPQYIILKPALVGGFSGAREWINLAEKRGIGWWITSALESNVGLNAIAQWTATFQPEIPQGLGTGALFTNNFPSMLSLKGDKLSFLAGTERDNSVFDNLDWRR